jgi:glycerol-3-phosphate dehydrogenase (NAD(P)+)
VAGGRTLVVGDGGWGTALAIHLARKGAPVAVWSHDAEYAQWVREHRTNPRFLPGYPIPPEVEVGHEMEALGAGSDLVVSAVPTEFLRRVWTRGAAALPHGAAVLSLSKGIEQGTLLRPSEILRHLLPGHPVAVLSGPNIAWEIAKGQPAASVVAGPDPAVVAAVQERLSSPTFRVYALGDPVGVELGGALKNIVAIAAGLCDGMNLGQNTKAALVTRGIVEMARLGVAMGGERATFFGLSGLGDLMTTCYSATSRNRQLGERLGRGEQAKDVLASSAQIAEGAKSAAPVRALARRHALEMPIAEEVYLILHEDRDPRASVAALMQRDPKSE